ncbi:MAG TPA: lysophospholipid acyltransferase family protein [Propionibacteriaceae bacterium]|nr:lysophospholipid acyltransferase family protein [Propionibacteriaceae bacterium]
MWYELFKYGIFTPAVRGLVRPWVTGAENIPTTGGAILAANHLAAAETILLPASIRRRMTFPAKAELFRGDRGPASKVVAWFLTAVGQVPMDRSGGRASAQGLQPVVDALEAGALVGIFPEGTRSPDGRLYKGKTGVARLVVATGAPVLPVGMVGTQAVRGPLGVPVLRRPGIIIGAPLDFSQYRGATDQRTLRYITDRIMAAIQDLTGQQYVDVYGSRVKHGDLEGADLSDRELDHPGEGSVAPPVPVPAE